MKLSPSCLRARKETQSGRARRPLRSFSAHVLRVALCVAPCTAVLSTRAVAAEGVAYHIEGVFPFVGRSGPAPLLVQNAAFGITFTVTNFTKTWYSFGNQYGDYAVSSAYVSVPAFGLSDSPVASTNLELFLFDDGTREQFSLNIILEQTQSSRATSTMLIEKRGLDFIENPNLPSPLRFNLYDTPILTDAGWATGVALADGSMVGVWTHGWPEYGYGSLTNIPEPGAARLVKMALALWSIHLLCNASRKAGLTTPHPPGQS